MDSLKISHTVIQNRAENRDFIFRIGLTKLVEHGQRLFEESTNMLILGDNAIVLRKLLDDKDICGKVNLIYIDPPFATNQSFTRNGNRTATVSRSQEDEVAYHDKLIGQKYLDS